MNGTGTSNFWCLHVGILIIHTIFYLYGFHDVVVQCCLHGLLSINFRSCTDGIASDIKKLLSIGIFRIHSWFGLCGLCFLPISLGFLTLRPSTFSSKFQLIRSKSFSLGFPSFGVLIVSKVTCMYSFVLVVVWCCLGGFRLLLVSVALHTSRSCHLYTKLLVLGAIVAGIGFCTCGAFAATRWFVFGGKRWVEWVFVSGKKLRLFLVRVEESHKFPVRVEMNKSVSCGKSDLF